MWLGGAVADIVKYHGCLLIVHNGMTMDGNVLDLTKYSLTHLKL